MKISLSIFFTIFLSIANCKTCIDLIDQVSYSFLDTLNSGTKDGLIDKFDRSCEKLVDDLTNLSESSRDVISDDLKQIIVKGRSSLQGVDSYVYSNFLGKVYMIKEMIENKDYKLTQVDRIKTLASKKSFSDIGSALNDEINNFARKSK